MLLLVFSSFEALLISSSSSLGGLSGFAEENEDGYYWRSCLIMFLYIMSCFLFIFFYFWWLRRPSSVSWDFYSHPVYMDRRLNYILRNFLHVCLWTSWNDIIDLNAFIFHVWTLILRPFPWIDIMSLAVHWMCQGTIYLNKEIFVWIYKSTIYIFKLL